MSFIMSYKCKKCGYLFNLDLPIQASGNAMVTSNPSCGCLKCGSKNIGVSDAFELAEKARCEQDPTSAKRMINDALSFQPDCHHALEIGVNIAAAIEDKDMFSKLSERLVRLFPKTAASHFHRGNYLSRFIGDFNAALGHYMKGAELDPNDIDYIVNGAACYMNMGRHREAAQFLESARDRFTEDEQCWVIDFNLVSCYGVYDRKKAKVAIKKFQDIYKKHPAKEHFENISNEICP